VANCGNPGTFFGFPSAGYVVFASDVTGGRLMAVSPDGVLGTYRNDSWSEAQSRRVSEKSWQADA
jgi:hypothetical protein